MGYEMRGEEEHRYLLSVWVKNQREALGMTQADVARGIQVTAGAVSNWESGRHRMTAYCHHKLSWFFRRQWSARAMSAPETKEPGRPVRELRGAEDAA